MLPSSFLCLQQKSRTSHRPFCCLFDSSAWYQWLNAVIFCLLNHRNPFIYGWYKWNMVCDRQKYVDCRPYLWQDSNDWITASVVCINIMRDKACFKVSWITQCNRCSSGHIQIFRKNKLNAFYHSCTKARLFSFYVRKSMAVPYESSIHVYFCDSI